MVFICFVCDALHPNIPQLMQHYRGVHHLGALLFQVFPCRQLGCGRFYDRLESLARHLETHVADIDLNNNVNYDNVDNNGDFVIFDNVVDNVDIEPVQPIEPVNVGHGALNINNVPLTLEEFVILVSSSALRFVAKLYADPVLPRGLIQTIIDHFNNFLTGSYLAHLKDKVYHILPVENRAELDGYFRIVQNPFTGLETEHLRFNAFIADHKLIKPKPFEIGVKDKTVNVQGHAELQLHPTKGHSLPMRDVLKFFLEMPHVLDTIIANMRVVENDTESFHDYLQSDSWKRSKTHFNGRLVLPINLHGDGYDPDNLNGSHSGDHGIEALYFSLPCIPKEHQATLKNMFIASMCLTKDKGEGNAAIFDTVLDELEFLSETGIDINTTNGVQRVYFVLGLIIGDNKGLNEMLGFQPGFGANYYCRFCKMHRDRAQYQTFEDGNLLRTVDNYNIDVALENPPLTGVVENCVFNGVAGYHCILNASLDISHDFLEGICKYGMAHVLYYLIFVREYFTPEDLQIIVATFDYGIVEGKNKPPASKLSRDRIQSHSLNFSAIEMLCFVRHLGLMIGHLVPPHDEVWLYFLKLQETIDFVMAPAFYPGWQEYLQVIITEHHEMYIALFNDPLKPKHHLAAHLGQRISQMGPPVHIWALDLERKHRESKQYARVCLNRINLTYSLVLKHSLQLCQLFLSGEAFRNVIELSSSYIVRFRDVHRYCDIRNLIDHPGDTICTVSRTAASSHGNKYHNKCILLYDTDNNVPLFGSVFLFLLFDSEIFFLMDRMITVEKNSHVNSYHVRESNEIVVVRQSRLLCYKPLHLREYEGNYYVTPRSVA